MIPLPTLFGYELDLKLITVDGARIDISDALKLDEHRSLPTLDVDRVLDKIHEHELQGGA